MSTVGSTSSSSSSSAASSSVTYNGHYFGLASGLDVDSLVTALVSDKQEQIDKANQQKQTLEWQQQAYQSIISSLNTFMSTYLSTGGSSSMLPVSAYNTYTPSVTGSSAISAIVTSAIDGSATHHISVTQSAVAGSVTGNALSTAITGTLSAGGTVGADLAGTSMNVTVDGLQKTVSFTQEEVAANGSSYSSMAALIQTKINSAFGYPVDSADPTDIKVSVTADSAGKLTIDSSSRYASAISVSASGTVTGTAGVTADTIKGTSFNMTVTGADGTAQTQTISFGAGDTVTDLTSYIQGKIDGAFGSNVLSVTVNSTGQVSFQSAGTAAPSFSFAKDPSATGDGLAALGIADGTSVADSLTALGITGAGGTADKASNRLSLGASIADLFGGAVTGGGSDGKTFTVTVNGKDIALSTDDTLSQAFNAINTSGAGVTVSYSSLTNTVRMKSTTTGASTTVGYNDNGSSFFSTLLGGTPPDSNMVKGQDAVFTLDGTSLSRSTNSFTVDGVTYSVGPSITPSTAQSADISFTQDVSGAVAGITNFVKAYNSLIDAINTQLTTKPDSNYSPLTDSQKKSMSDSDIEKWNEKAQSGLLFADDTLTGIVDTMRSMLYQPVTASDGSTITLYQIGITTTDDVTKGGQLQIDTAKLTKALQNNSAAVSDLFTKQSGTYYHLDMAGQSQRKTEEGLAYRLQDIVNDATSTGVYPYVGSLVAIAGTSGDTSTSYSINRQLKAIDNQIDEYTQQMTDKKNALYTQFTTLESFMSQMNTQSSMISSFMSGSGSG